MDQQLGEPQAVLFDIDGTLIESGGASDRAWHHAFEELAGVDVDVGAHTGRGVPDPEVGRELIVAYTQPDKLNDVKDALFKADVGKMSVIPDARGCGQQKGYTEAYRGHVTEINLRPKVRLEIAVNDAFVQATVDAIIRGARTGKIGDGKIFIIPLEECIRIRTGETGGEAIG